MSETPRERAIARIGLAIVRAPVTAGACPHCGAWGMTGREQATHECEHTTSKVCQK